MRFIQTRILGCMKNKKAAKKISIVLAYLFVLSIVAIFLVIIIPRLVESIRTLAGQFDEYLTSFNAWVAALWKRTDGTAVSDTVRSVAQSLLERVNTFIEALAPWLLNVTVSLLSGIFTTIIAFVFSCYILYNKDKLLEQLKCIMYATFEKKRADAIVEIGSMSNETMRKYIQGVLIECFILGVACFIGMQLFNMPYALLISFCIGATQIVPIIGPWVGGIFGACIILVINPMMALWFVIFLLILQQVENNTVYPRVVGNAVGLSGMWVLLAILVGGGLFGFKGIILAVPVMSILYTLMGRWTKRRLCEKAAAERVKIR